MKFCAIILAGGNGERFGGDVKKQFAMLRGKPVWKWVRDTAEGHFNDIVVVGVDVRGGKTRQESVKNGLDAIQGEYVVIFDSVRPMVTGEQIERMKDAVVEHPSVSFGMEPSDTILDAGVYKRKGLIALQVPQAFDLMMIKEAHLKTRMNNATDDTVIFKEKWNIAPKILNGGINLHKITYPDDFIIIQALCPN